jgi:hypothetical protein
VVDVYHAFLGYKYDFTEQNKNIWEHTRQIAFYSAVHVLPKGKRDIKQFMIFPWERESHEKGTSGNPWTKEEIIRMKKSGNKFLNNGTK